MNKNILLLFSLLLFSMCDNTEDPTQDEDPPPGQLTDFKVDPESLSMDSNGGTAIVIVENVNWSIFSVSEIQGNDTVFIRNSFEYEGKYSDVFEINYGYISKRESTLEIEMYPNIGTERSLVIEIGGVGLEWKYIRIEQEAAGHIVDPPPGEVTDFNVHPEKISMDNQGRMTIVTVENVNWSIFSVFEIQENDSIFIENSFEYEGKFSDIFETNYARISKENPTTLQIEMHPNPGTKRSLVVNIGGLGLAWKYINVQQEGL